MNPQNRDPFDPAAESGRIRAPWERGFERLLSPFEEFIHRQTAGGMVLMVSAILALVLANSGAAGAYEHLLHLPARIGIGDWGIEKSLHHWINDGLMALFFFVVGLELKREMLVGELANPRHAILPILAAIGGMLVPALIYTAFNGGGEGARGWGIPMATDIAFSIGALALLAGRVPRALITFLVALAIVDDLGAVLVIALFYTEHLALGWLAGAAVVLAAMLVLNLAGVRRSLPYFLCSAVLWYLLLESGVHATLAGVLGAFIVPVRPRYDPALFSRRTRVLLERFDACCRPGASILADEELRTVAQALGDEAIQVQAPLQRLERLWNLPVAFLVVPVFALANAGIPLDFGTLAAALAHPVTQGVVLGLVCGKFIGITGTVWLALRFGVGELPPGTRMTQIAGVALLGGIGFTMSMFVAELGFAAQPEELLMAKTGILLASLVAGISGYIGLRLATRPPPRAVSPDREG